MVKKDKMPELAGRATCILGIDPGLDGGLALLLAGCGHNGYERMLIAKMPVREEIVSRKKRRYVADASLAELIKGWNKTYPISAIHLENVHASSQMGVSSAFSFGRTFGCIVGCISGMGLRPKLQFVEPSVWKRKLLLSANKKDAVAMAKKNWPTVKFGSHDGMAEAALIALYGLEHAPEVDPLS